MKITQVDIYGQLRGAGVDVDELREQMEMSELQYFRYTIHLKDDEEYCETINVESTAKSVMDEFTRMSVDYQERFFTLIARILKNPGEQIVLTGDQKKRGARIVRLASEDDFEHNFLLTH